MPATHIELTGSRRPPRKDSRRVRDLDPHAHVEVTVTLHGPELPKADAMPARALSPREFADKYGVSDANVQKVETVLRGFGLAVQDVSHDRRSLRVSGTAAAVEAAFRPGMAIYHSADQGEYRGREGTLHIPAELDGIVSGVFGIDQRQVAHRKAVQTRSSSQSRVAADRASPALASTPLTPMDLEQRYAFPPGDAAGQTIAIAEFGIPQSNSSVTPPAYVADDVTSFCQKYGRAVPNVEVVPVNLVPLTQQQLEQLPPDAQQASAGLTGEVMMDVEIVAALCPAARIRVFFASFDEKGWIDLLDQVAAADPDRPVSLSISWGLAEDSPEWSQGAVTEIGGRLQAAAMQGITICVSSGDDGSGDGMNDNRGHVDFPGSSPFVLCVGGTMLTAAGDEVTWWQSPGRRTPKGTGATGGGVSAVTPRPSWQTVTVASINPSGLQGRIVPDVAALAGPPLYDLVLFGQDQPNGGTSASAPLWAALLARVNAALPAAKRQRFLTPLLYGPGQGGQPLGQSVCRDITQGQNASRPQPGRGYQAGVGFDAVTGWGVPNGAGLLQALS